MDFLFTPDSALPKFAWLATIEPERAIARVRHGVWVETHPDGFVEGVWDGTFGTMDIDASACVFGSGARRRGNALIVVPSTATTDYVFWASEAGTGRVEVSNSLSLLLAKLGDELDPSGPDYARVNSSLMCGIVEAIREIPTRRGSVNRLIHRNLIVGTGAPVEIDKPLPPRFVGFDDYCAYLNGRYGSIAANARDPRRHRRMAILSTQSRGYDSTAMNAIARKFGLDHVFTVRRGKAKGYFANEDRGRETDDDGTEICNILELPCVSIERRYIESHRGREYLYYASMHEASDANLDEIAEHVTAPSVLLTGCLGEMWYPTSYYRERPGLLDANLRRVDLGNHGMTELRLEAGYVQLAFPFIGARSREDIVRITESREMDAWRLGTSYDRPIPRRIAEEGGVPREVFGQVKMASVLELPPPPVPLDPSLRSEFFDFLAEHRILVAGRLLLPLVRRWNAVVCTVSPTRHRWAYWIQRAICRILGRSQPLPLLFMRLESTLFCFCVNKRTSEYALVLGRNATQGFHEEAPRRGAREQAATGSAR